MMVLLVVDNGLAGKHYLKAVSSQVVVALKFVGLADQRLALVHVLNNEHVLL